MPESALIGAFVFTVYIAIPLFLFAIWVELRAMRKLLEKKHEWLNMPNPLT